MNWKPTCDLLIRLLPFVGLAFVFLSMEVVVEVVDGPNLKLYGFPLPWHWDARFVSLEKSVNWTACALDVLFYLVVCFFLVRFTAVKDQLERLNSFVIGLAWVVSALVLIVSFSLISVFDLSSEPFLPLIPDQISNVVTIDWSLVIPLEGP